MIYLLQPDPAKSVANRRLFSLARALHANDVPCAVATPGGRAPMCFMAMEPVVAWETIWPGLSASDRLIGFQPPRERTPARFTAYDGHRLQAPDGTWSGPGFSIPDFIFSTPGDVRVNRVCFSGLRRQWELRRWLRVFPKAEFLSVDTEHELDAARLLRESPVAVFLRAAPEALVSPFEALAAGCRVIVAADHPDASLVASEVGVAVGSRIRLTAAAGRSATSAPDRDRWKSYCEAEFRRRVGENLRGSWSFLRA